MNLTENDINFGMMKADAILHHFVIHELSERILAIEDHFAPTTQETFDRINAKIQELAHVLTEKNDCFETLDYVVRVKLHTMEKLKTIDKHFPEYISKLWP